MSNSASIHDLFESVLGTLNGFVFRCWGAEADYEMIDLSPVGFHRLTGREASKFIGPDGARWNSVILPEDLAELENKQKLETANKGTWEYFYRIVRADGRHAWIHETGWIDRCHETRKEILVGMMLDASTVKKVEEKEILFRERISSISVHTLAIVRLLDRLRLLSLNARIEAARAGQGGLGFEQVSSEMKRLADQASSLLSGINTPDQKQDKAAA